MSGTARRWIRLAYWALLLTLFLAFRDTDAFGYALTVWGVLFVLFGVGPGRLRRTAEPTAATPTPPEDAP